MKMPTWLDEPETETVDFLGGESAEDYLEDINGEGDEFGSESLNGDSEAAESTSLAVRRARARRARRRALARARAAQAARARGRGMVPARPGAATPAAEVRRTQAAVRTLDLENKVQSDTFGSALSAQSKRISGSEAAVALGTVVNQLRTSFPNLVENKVIAAGLPLTPLLLLRPARRGSGFGAVAGDPRVWASAIVAGLAIAGEFSRRSQEAQDVTITGAPGSLEVGDVGRIQAAALDATGKVIPGKRLTFTAEPAGVVVINERGIVTATGAGKAKVQANLDGLFDVRMIVVSAPASGGSGDSGSGGTG
jgi:hypothetical protein